jgi:tRNA pseudouridine13 synthase
VVTLAIDQQPVRVRVCADLPGTGGMYKLTPEDFEVEEIPAYLPSGAGEHTFLWIEKRGLTTPQAVARLCEALGAPRHEAGTAGLKDQQALTRQWVSLPRVDPARACGLALSGVRVLAADRHGNKLRTGHSRGNRFTVAITGAGAGATERASAVVTRLRESGMPNLYGDQRFGRASDNAGRGVAVLRRQIHVRDPRERRLLVSAAQSALFNRVVKKRLAAGLLTSALLGDVLCRLPSGAAFVCADAAADQPRVTAGEVAVTGPMFGPKMLTPAPGSAAAQMEATVLAEAELAEDEFARGGRLCEGARRPLVVRPGELRVEPEREGRLVLRFTLPAGSYATVLLSEVIGG